MPARIPNAFALGESIGLEFETDNVYNYDAQRELEGSTYDVAHDASIESDATFDPRTGTLMKNSPLKKGRDTSRVTVGTEIVSKPVDTEIGNADAMVKHLTKWLTEYGEPATSLRSGIHIHVGLGSTNVGMLKAAISWGRRLEALFFHLAGNGYMFRGVSNSSAYCRPITKNGPPYVAGRSEYLKTFDLDQLMCANSSREFWYMYGGTNPNSVPRYVPHRYIWLNFYSLLAHGTLEFRPWNKVLNPNFIIAEIELCKKFTSAVIKCMPTDGIEHSAFDMSTIGLDGIIQDLNMVCDMWDISDRTRKVLNTIARITPLCTGLVNEPLLSHITNYSPVWDGSFSFTPLKSKEVARPDIVTIHRLRGEPDRN